MFGHLLPPKTAMDEVAGAFSTSAHNGYTASAGSATARAAVAMRYSLPDRPPLRTEDVFMTVGCSEALSHSFAAMAVEGANILLPRPGFPLYETLCHRHGLGYKFYDLDDESGWEVKIDDVRRLRDENTVAIVVKDVRTPSSPTGAGLTNGAIKVTDGSAGIVADGTGVTFDAIPKGAIAGGTFQSAVDFPGQKSDHTLTFTAVGQIIVDGTIAQDQAQSAAIWAVRQQRRPTRDGRAERRGLRSQATGWRARRKS